MEAIDARLRSIKRIYLATKQVKSDLLREGATYASSPAFTRGAGGATPIRESRSRSRSPEYFEPAQDVDREVRRELRVRDRIGVLPEPNVHFHVVAYEMGYCLHCGARTMERLKEKCIREYSPKHKHYRHRRKKSKKHHNRQF